MESPIMFVGKNTFRLGFVFDFLKDWQEDYFQVCFDVLQRKIIPALLCFRLEGWGRAGLEGNEKKE